MIRGRRGEHWTRSFHATPWVSYAEALCWIFYRDVATIATLGTVSTTQDYAEMSSGMVSALLAVEAGQDDWWSASPELALMDALEAGSVTATAAPFMYVDQVSGGGYHLRTARREIDPVEWLDVRLFDASAPFDKATTAYPKGHLAGAVVRGGFTDIWFSRANLTQVFPGQGANQVIRLASLAGEKRPTQTDYMLSHAVLAAAVAELRADGADDPGKLAILRKVAHAYHAAGYATEGQSAESVFASMKAQSPRLGLTKEMMLRRAARG